MHGMSTKASSDTKLFNFAVSFEAQKNFHFFINKMLFFIIDFC